MITQRDREILKFVDEYGYITIEQAKVLFFNDKNLGTGYEMARRRLSMLVKAGELKSGKIQTNNKNVYYKGIKPSYHNITIIDCLCKLVEVGAKIIRFEKNKSWLDDLIISDAYCECEFNDCIYQFIFEICYMNKNIPIQNYVKLYSTFDTNSMCPLIVKVNLLGENKKNYGALKDCIVDVDYQFNQFAKIFI